MAIERSNGIIVVDAPPGWTPIGDQATLCRLENTNTFYHWNGSAWVTSVMAGATNGLTNSSGNIVLGDSAAGTSEAGVLTSDRFINQDGFSLNFIGESAAVPTTITIHPEGYLEYISDDNAVGRHVRRVVPIQQDEGNTSWYEGISTHVNIGSDRNNDVFVAGWNMDYASGAVDATKTRFGYGFENYYSPGADQICEFHLMLGEANGGTLHRFYSTYMPIGFPDQWLTGLISSTFAFQDPNNTAVYATLSSVGTTQVLFNLSGSASQTGVSFTVDAAATNIQITNNFAGTGRIIYMDSSWDRVQLPSFNSYVAGGGNYNTAVKNLLAATDNDCELGINGFRFSIYRGCGIDVSLPAAFATKLFTVSNTGVITMPQVVAQTSYADDTAAGVGGIATGQIYKSTDGILRVKL